VLRPTVVWFRLVSDGRPLSEVQDAWGHLTSDNVRLAHRLCNRRDYEWRTSINAMLGNKLSLEKIAAELNARKVPPIHSATGWTPSSVRKAFVS
jgi:hypothetical protein